MRFENSFDVDAPLDTVWNTLLDVEQVAPTVPGASVLERTSDDAYKVAIKVKVGPMSMTYKGDVEIVERDEQAHRAVMKARAKESRGQGTADADVTMVLSGEDGRTSAVVTTEVELSGKAAQMGQGVLQDVAGRLVQTFAANLATMLASGGSGAPATSGVGAPAVPGREAEPAPSAERERPGTPPPTPQGPAAAADDALDLGSIGGAVIADRLQDPRRLGGLLAIVALIAYLLGRRSAS